MDVQLNNSAFDQLTASRDYTRQKAALAARIAHPSDQSFGLGWLEPGLVENGERTRKAALARSFIHFVTASTATLMESQCKEWLPASKGPAVQKEPSPGLSVAASNMEITYRVALSLMEREQVSLARKALDSLPVGQLGDPIITRLRKMLAVPITKTSRKRDIDRALDYQWIRDHAQEYRGQWVALYNGELLGAATSLRELLDRVKSLRSEHRPLLHQIS
jgi:Family of unknown function (DUF5678)